MRGAMPGLVAEAPPTKALTTSAAIETDPCRIVVLAHLMTYLPMPRLLLAGSIFVICSMQCPTTAPQKWITKVRGRQENLLLNTTIVLSKFRRAPQLRFRFYLWTDNVLTRN